MTIDMSRREGYMRGYLQKTAVPQTKRIGPGSIGYRSMDTDNPYAERITHHLRNIGDRLIGNPVTVKAEVPGP